MKTKYYWKVVSVGDCFGGRTNQREEVQSTETLLGRTLVIDNILYVL